MSCTDATCQDWLHRSGTGTSRRANFASRFDVAELSDEIIDITVERASKVKSPLTSFPIWQKGGAKSCVDDDETPFGGRQAAFTYSIGCCTETDFFRINQNTPPN